MNDLTNLTTVVINVHTEMMRLTANNDEELHHLAHKLTKQWQSMFEIVRQEIHKFSEHWHC